MQTTMIYLGDGSAPSELNPRYCNRHGLIAGATGTGKTVTLQVLAESFSKLGVPVFLADVKGDLSGLAQAISPHPKIDQRLEKMSVPDYRPRPFPTIFWDVFGQQGHPIRTTISEIGPLLLANLLELNDTQEGVLNVAFRVADEEGLLLFDLKDLRALLSYVAEQRKEFSRDYGNVSAASIAAIQRRLLVLEQQGVEHFFGEPALHLEDLMRTDLSGTGIINVLAADKLIHSPRLYSTVLLWLLSELFEELPEIGDPDKPKLVFFFDEAHLLFDQAPRALLQKVEQVVRLIRSKGVSIFFVTQNPLDVPDDVLGQLGNRVQHALRAFTPREQKAVRAAAQTFRQNPDLDTETVITELGVGEALISTLQDKGIPGVVQRCLLRPPESRIGPIDQSQREQVRARSPLGSKYDQSIDRESAFERLAARAEQAAAAQARQAEQAAADKAERTKAAKRKPARRSNRQSIWETMGKSVARTIGSQLGRQIIRGVLGSMTKR